MALSRKREARKRLGREGWVTFEGGFAARKCMVDDISKAGAKITLDGAAALPATIRLAFSRDARSGHSCVVVWRRGQSAGIKFVR